MDVKLSRTPLNTDTPLIQTLSKVPSVSLSTRVDSVLKSGADFLFPGKYYDNCYLALKVPSHAGHDGEN